MRMKQEVEQILQIADCRPVCRNVRIGSGNGVRQIVAAARGERRHVPVRLDEFQDRDVVRVGVRDVPAGAVGRDDDHGNARAVAKEVERVHIARVIEPATFVNRNKDRRAGPELLVSLDHINDLFDETFEEDKLR